jgi:hypothetical protein
MQYLMKRPIVSALLLAACLSVALLTACQSLPDNVPAAAGSATPIDSSRLIVLRKLVFMPSLSGVSFPPGEYIPVAKDAYGTYYMSPEGVDMLSITGSTHFPVGGIYAGTDARGRAFLRAWAKGYPMQRDLFDTSLGSFSENVRIVQAP